MSKNLWWPYDYGLDQWTYDLKKWSLEDFLFLAELEYRRQRFGTEFSEVHCRCQGEKPSKKKTVFRGPFEFKNSISQFFRNMKAKKTLTDLGSFTITGNQIIVCCPLESTLNRVTNDQLLYGCRRLPTKTKKLTVYLIDSSHHWIEHDSEQEWEGAVLAYDERISDEEFDSLQWFHESASVNGDLGIFDANSYGKISYLPQYMIKRAQTKKAKDWYEGETWADIINKNKYLDDFPKYLKLPNGIVFETPEMRGRNYMYGINSDGNTVAILIPSLF